jgi:hypothetical protein
LLGFPDPFPSRSVLLPEWLYFLSLPEVTEATEIDGLGVVGASDAPGKVSLGLFSGHPEDSGFLEQCVAQTELLPQRRGRVLGAIDPITLQPGEVYWVGLMVSEASYSTYYDNSPSFPDAFGVNGSPRENDVVEYVCSAEPLPRTMGNMGDTRWNVFARRGQRP